MNTTLGIGPEGSGRLSALLAPIARSPLLRGDLDYHLLRAAMVIVFAFFGYQKWFEYEFERLVPFISNGPLIFWLYWAFGYGGASWFLGSTFAGALSFVESTQPSVPSLSTHQPLIVFMNN